jgi:hypothetical protein
VSGPARAARSDASLPLDRRARRVYLPAMELADFDFDLP